MAVKPPKELEISGTYHRWLQCRTGRCSQDAHTLTAAEVPAHCYNAYLPRRNQHANLLALQVNVFKTEHDVHQAAA
ncbi:hypothetical protein ABBQ38_006707 [Trebouxia sp. C0009 RCD-2024]